jgi:eukaryotic-like serine/threonine-protein kinase
VVKLLHVGYARQGEALARFKAEARHAGALSHENIARVYDHGEPAGGQC